MKPLLIAATLASVLASNVTAETSWNRMELAVAGSYYIPQMDENFDSGLGAELQARLWFDSDACVALCVGSASWEIDDQVITFNDGRVAVNGSLDGDVSLTSLGGSMLVRPVNRDKLRVTMEAGLRYIIVDSRAEGELTATTTAGYYRREEGIVEMDDGAIGIIGVDIETVLSKHIALLFGLGYQFDIFRGDAEWQNHYMGLNELTALLARAGITVGF